MKKQQSYTSYQAFLFRLIYQAERFYFKGSMLYNRYLGSKLEKMNNNIFHGCVTKVERYSLLGLYKETLFQVTFIEMMFAAFLKHVLGDPAYEYYASRRVVYGIRQLDFSNKEDEIDNVVYRIVYYGGRSVLTRDRQDATPYHEAANHYGSLRHPKYLMVAVNSIIDFTRVYITHIDSFTADLDLTVPEFACLCGLITNTVPRDDLIDFIVNASTHLVVVDSETLDERVFKETEIVIL